MALKVSVSRVGSKNAGKPYSYLTGIERKVGYCKGGRFNTPELDQARVTFNGAKNRNKDITPTGEDKEAIFDMYYKAFMESLETGITHRVAMAQPKKSGGMWTLSNLKIVKKGESVNPKPKNAKKEKLDSQMELFDIDATQKDGKQLELF